jgi:hypothetical protein
MTEAEREFVTLNVMATFNGTSDTILRRGLGMQSADIRRLREWFADLQKVHVRSSDSGHGSDGEQPAGKRCGRCRLVLPLDRFSVNRGTRDGLRWYCRSCMSTWLKQYRDGKPGQRELERQWQRDHRARRKAASGPPGPK